MRASAREIETLNERALLYKDKIIERSARAPSCLRRAPTGVYVSRRQLSDREVTTPEADGPVGAGETRTCRLSFWLGTRAHADDEHMR